MPNDPLRGVRAQAQQYLLGVVSLPDFHRWFVEWRRANPEGEKHPLARGIDLRLAEYTTGHLTEAQLRGRLLDSIGIGGTVTLTPSTTTAMAFHTGYSEQREPPESDQTPLPDSG